MSMYPSQQQQQQQQQNGMPPPPPSSVPGMQSPTGGSGTVGGTNPVPDSYFTESRKGEISELRNLLRSFGTERDPQRKRDIIKKVIAYMTLGIDVSRLFSEMMLAIETRDLVIKKMIYLYLTNYARSYPELAQMCTNTLQKDCSNDDPMVRGLALRALCGLNLPSMVEYIGEPLRRGLNDNHGYVRKTAVMGVLKLYHLDEELYETNNFTNILYDMLRDTDPSVVCNCIIVLNEVMSKSPEGGMAINRAIMLHLLNRIHEFNEFAKVQILELVPRYIPANEEEGYQIMNLLDPLLRTADSGATMATMKAFLSLVEYVVSNNDNDEINIMKRQIIDRVKGPLVTLISSGSSEIMYTLLKHVELLQDVCPGSFDDEYRQFYVRYNEPTNVKYCKIEILARLADPDTAPDIVSELAEIVYDTNPKVGRLAVRAMGKVACNNQGGPGSAEAIARRLVEMLDLLNMDHISSEAAHSLTLMIRKQSTLKTLISPPLLRSLKYTNDPYGKASILYLLGECGEYVRNAPYAIEKLINNYDTIHSIDIKQALLTTTIKLFFIKPPEIQRMLGRLLSKICADVTSQDLHDRALLYYRLLRSGTSGGDDNDLSVLESIVKTNTTLNASIPFAEEQDSELRTELLNEFNTLSIIYGKPSTTFIAEEFQNHYTKMPIEHPLTSSSSGPVVDVGDGGHTMMQNDMYDNSAAAAVVTPAVAVAPVNTTMGNLLEDDLLGFGGPNSPSAAPVAAASTTTTTAATQLSLNSTLSMTGDVYQSTWASISDNDAIVSTVVLNTLPVSTDIVEQLLNTVHIKTMASGELPNEYKFFLYAQDISTSCTLLIQSNIEKTNDPLMILTTKVTPPNANVNQLVEKLTEMMTQVLN